MAYDENIYAKIVTGDLDDKTIAKLKETGEWAEIQSILKAGSDLNVPDFDKSQAYENLVARRDRESNKVISIKSSKRWMLPGIAASIVVLLGVAYLLFTQDSITTSYYAEQESVSMPDGTVIQINAGSTIAYNSDEWHENRTISLQGEAYFDVVKGTTFSVTSDMGRVDVLGTKFNARTWDEQLDVHCYEGRVRVSCEQSSTELMARQYAAVRSCDIITKDSIPKIRPAWLEGYSAFTETNLVHIFRELERQYQVDVEYPDDDRLFTGRFVHDNLDQALRMICEPMSLSYTIKKNGSVVIKDD